MPLFLLFVSAGVLFDGAFFPISILKRKNMNYHYSCFTVTKYLLFSISMCMNLLDEVNIFHVSNNLFWCIPFSFASDSDVDRWIWRRLDCMSASSPVFVDRSKAGKKHRRNSNVNKNSALSTLYCIHLLWDCSNKMRNSWSIIIHSSFRVKTWIYRRQKNQNQTSNLVI